MVLRNFLLRLRNVPLDAGLSPFFSLFNDHSLIYPYFPSSDAASLAILVASQQTHSRFADDASQSAPLQRVQEALSQQRNIADMIASFLADQGLVERALQITASIPQHIMDFAPFNSLNAFLSLLQETIKSVLLHNSRNSAFPITGEQLRSYVTKKVLYSILWGFGGPLPYTGREKLARALLSNAGVEVCSLSSVFYLNLSMCVLAPFITQPLRV